MNNVISTKEKDGRAVKRMPDDERRAITAPSEPTIKGC